MYNTLIIDETNMSYSKKKTRSGAKSFNISGIYYRRSHCQNWKLKWN